MIKKEGWEKKYLPEIAKISTGKWDANHAIKNGKYRFYTCAYDYQYCNTNRFSGECIILPGNGANVGEVFYYNGKFDAYQRTYVLSDIKILPKYLKYHMLLHWRAIGTKQQYGAATNFIKIGNFQNYHVEYPSLSIQHQIVSELDALSDIITKKKQQLEELDKLAQATFYDMFGDPVSNEKGWEIVKFTDVLILKRGYDLPIQDREVGSIPIMASNGILGYHNKHMVNGPGVITGRSGTLGQVHFIKDDYWPLNTALYSKNMNGNNPIYILYLLRNFHVERFSRGAGVPTLNRNLVHDELIIKTPIGLQNLFAKRIESIEKQKELINQSISEVQQLFDYTMDKYFN